MSRSMGSVNPHKWPSESLASVKSFALTAAKDLCYPHSVLILIREAETKEEINRIMMNARHGFYDKKEVK